MAIKVIAQRREVKLGKNPGEEVRDASRPVHPHLGEEPDL